MVMKCPRQIKIIVLTLAILLLTALAAGCSSNNEAVLIGSPQKNSGTDSQAENQVREALHYTAYDSVNWYAVDLDETFSMLDATLVHLQGNNIVAEGVGAEVEGSKLLITAAGTYIITGDLQNGQIIVNTPEDETVRIILNGVDITNTDTAPFFVQNAGKVVVTLAEETVNTFTDGEEYLLPPQKTEPDAAFFSCSDLTINGSGTLKIFGKYRHGLVSKNNLKIINARVKVNAAEIGIRSGDLLAIRDANIALKAGLDGIQAVSNADPKRGLVVIKGSMIDIYSVQKGIEAAEDIVVVDGEITIESGSGFSINNTGKS